MKRLGIYPRWETEDQLLSGIEKSWEQLRQDIWELRWRDLEAYARGVNPFTDVSGTSPAKYLSHAILMKTRLIL
jgi:hypothetical protein